MTTFAAAVLHADFKRLPEQMRTLDASGIDRYHFDIMDGHFVPNFGLNPLIITALRGLTQTPFEVHLMIEHPEHYIDMMAQTGAAAIIVHAETTIQLRRVISQIRKAGCRPGIALNPTTPPDALSYVLPDVASVLLLSADAGVSDQSFAESTLDKIHEVRDMITDQRLAVEIEVDGGLNNATITRCVRAGADMLVLGASGLFSQPDLAGALKAAQQLAMSASQMQA